MSSTQLVFSAPHNNMYRMLVIRSMFFMASIIAIGLSYWWLQLPLFYTPILTILCSLALINIATYWRLTLVQSVSEVELFIQLFVDLLSISLLLYFLGGADNPFVSYYLVPISIATVTLPWFFVLPLTVLALVQYSLLFYFYIPLPDLAPHQHDSVSEDVNLHSLGMWFNFLVSAIIITFFGLKMAQALRRQDAELAEQREDNWRDEQLMAVATLAAGTAHDLATPLTTIKTLTSELCHEYQDNPQLLQDLTLLQNQVVHCTQTLQQLHDRAELMQGHDGNRQGLTTYCQQLIDRWLLLHPGVSADFSIDEKSPNISAIFDPTIEQSIGNLLNNAAEASPADIIIVCSWDYSALTLIIEDNGPGINDEVALRLGQPFNSSKGKGRGLGLFLTQATITRNGGTVSLEMREEVGTRTTVSLPLKSVQKEQQL